MGKKNPLKEAGHAVTGALFNPIREIGRTVGADGIVKGADDVKGAYNRVGDGGIDLTNNEKGKMQKKADIENGEIQKKQAAAAASAASAAATAENDRMESERMSGGTASRTLLTGPAGLEDEEQSISRRTLRAGR